MIVDTDILIDVLRDHSAAVEFFRSQLTGDHALALSAITLTEIEAGLRDPERPAAEMFLSRMHLIGVDEQIARTAGVYRRDYGRSHGLETPDALIAATARHHGGILCTLNRKHYPMKDIEVRIPYQK